MEGINLFMITKAGPLNQLNVLAVGFLTFKEFLEVNDFRIIHFCLSNFQLSQL